MPCLSVRARSDGRPGACGRTAMRRKGERAARGLPVPSRATCAALAHQEVLVRNHDQKCKDIAESILPSKARIRARTYRRQIHGRERCAVRTALAHADWDVLDARIADAAGRTKSDLR